MSAWAQRTSARKSGELDNQEQNNQRGVERVVTGLAGAAFEGLETVESGISALWKFEK